MTQAHQHLARRMYLLQFGAEPSPKSISVRGANESLLWCPIVGVAVETNAGWILLDTGIGRPLLEDESARRHIYASEEQPYGVGEDPLQSALGLVGLRPTDFAQAAVSHLHCDHTGGLRSLAEADVPVAVQARELSFALEHADLEQAYYRMDYEGPDICWHELYGDVELAPGVWALSTPGHTPGHMSYRVDLPETGTWVFAMDAADLGENLTDQTPPGSTVNLEDSSLAEDSLRRLLRESKVLGARLVPGHDQAFWNAVWHPLKGHQ